MRKIKITFIAAMLAIVAITSCVSASSNVQECVADNAYDHRYGDTRSTFRAIGEDGAQCCLAH